MTARVENKNFRLGQQIKALAHRISLRAKLGRNWKWIEGCRDIQGWLTDAEAAALFELAKNMTPHTGSRLVELGSWQGKSSVVLAGGIVGKQDAKLYCIDPFGQDENATYQQTYYDPLLRSEPRTMEEIFALNIQRSGVERVVTPMKGYSFDFGETWKEPIDLLFIDANHEYECVLRDFRTWERHVKRGGVIAFHDANGVWPGPTRVVDEVLCSPRFGNVRKADSIAWAIKARKL
jgi:MMP 1-O-methyltransferase